MESQSGKDHSADFPAGALRRAFTETGTRSAAVTHDARPGIPRSFQAPAARCRARTIRKRTCAATVPVQGVAVRHLAGGQPIEDLADGIGDPRVRSGKRLSALPGRLVQSRARTNG